MQYTLIKQLSTAIPILLAQLTIVIAIQGKKNVIISCIYRSHNGDFDKFNRSVDVFTFKEEMLFLYAAILYLLQYLLH